MPALAQVARSRAAVLRSQSVGRRCAGNGTTRLAWLPPTPGVAAARSPARARAQPAGSSTSSSRNTTQVALTERHPAFRAAAGSRPPDRSTRTGHGAPLAGRCAASSRGSGPSRLRWRSSTTTTSTGGGCASSVTWAARLLSGTPSDGRPMVGMTTAYCAGFTWTPLRRARHLARRTRCGPSTRTSTGADPNSSSASRGSSTMGRPAVFRLGLMTTGSPVRASNARSIAPNRGWIAGSTVWMRAVSSTCTAAGMRSHQLGLTLCTKSM